MAFAIIIILLSFLLFSLEAMKIIKDSSTSKIYLLILQFIGIVIAFSQLLINRNISIVAYTFIILFSIILPIMYEIMGKRNINLDEMLMSLRINYKRSDVKEQLLKIIDKYPESASAHKKLAMYYEENNENTKAEDEYIKVVQINQNDYKTYCKLAEILRKNEKYDEAIQTLNLVLHKKPEMYEASILLADILYENNKFKDAISVYYQAIKYHPTEYDLYYRLGMTFVRLNDFQNAKECYKKAATLNSLKDVSNLNLGQINMIFKDYDGAEKYFYEVLDCEDNKVSAYAYYNLARIRMIKNDKENAIKYINLSIELYPHIAKKVEKDEEFLTILGEVQTKHYRDIRSELKESDEKTITYLEQTFSKVKNLTSSYDDIKISLERNANQKEIE